MSDPTTTEALKQALTAIKQLRAKLEVYERAKSEPIAVIGMGCRLPGGVDTPERFWALLEDSVDAISEVPAYRWDASAYRSESRGPGSLYVSQGGFLGDVCGFDAAFFGIAPKEAVSMDPQQRLMLEVSYEALEHAGLAPGQLAGRRGGVFVGQVTSDYAVRRFMGDPHEIDPYCGTGSYASVLSGRISFLLGLQGPSISLDTACSTSLVAIHLAVNSLRQGECDFALAGGVNLLLEPNHHIYYCALDALAPDGRCKAFDAAADGFVKSEGCGAVILMRLSEAQRAGLRVLALIRGSAVGHDGRSSGLTVPNGPAQVAVAKVAMAVANVTGEDIDAVEAHGTGTALGDPIELQALLEALRDGSQRPLIVGSVKSQIGHTESAAGVISLIKAVLALGHRRFPANLHFHSLNPRVEVGVAALVVPTKSVALTAERPLRISVTSIGISGTNAHVIVEETERVSAPAGLEGPCLLTLSARSEGALELQMASWIGFLTSTSAPFSAICRQAALHRDHHPERLALVASNAMEAVDGLRAALQGGDSALFARARASLQERPKLVFFYSGQGSQWLGMGRALMAAYPVFREKLEACDRYCQTLEGWSILAELNADSQASRLTETAVAQPLIFAIQVALTELLTSLGTMPAAVIGHSMGEVAAAHVAGILSLEDAVRIICARSRIVRQAPPGGMAMLELTVAKCAERLRAYAGRLEIAASNGPTSTVVSGDRDALDALLADSSANGVYCRKINVDYASHCFHMDPLREQILRELAPTRAQSARLRFYSTVRQTTLAGSELNAAYWAENLRRQVGFQAMIERALSDGHSIFVEVSPHPILTYAVAEAIQAGGAKASVTGLLRREEEEGVSLLRSLARLHCHGLALDFARLMPTAQAWVDLPTYSWQRTAYWLAPRQARQHLEVATPLALRTAELAPGDPLSDQVTRLTSRYGLAPQTLGQATGKQFLFLNSSRTGLFFFNRRGGSLVAINYTGAPESFMDTVRELREFCGRYRLQLELLLEIPRQPDQLQALGLSTTVVGVWSEIRELASFQLSGTRMRRLRYAVARYAESGVIDIVRHYFGRDLESDCRCYALMDAWARLRLSAQVLVERLKRSLPQQLGPTEQARRAYLIQRDGELDGLVLLSPSPDSHGYLMDMEFYAENVPQGCMEFGVVTLIERLAAEGFQTFSLGLTLGTQLEPIAGEELAVRRFFEQLREQNVLNGDANLQFKNKFRPEHRQALLVRAAGAETDSLHRLLEMLGDPLGLQVQERWEPGFLGDAACAAPDLLGPAKIIADFGTVHESVLAPGEQAWLWDHEVCGQALMPLAAMLELGWRAIAATDGVALADVELDRPLPLGAPLHLQISLRRESGQTQLALYSRADEQADWRRHFRALQSAPSRASEVDLAEVRRACSEPVDVAAFYAERRNIGYAYGRAFQCLQALFRGTDEALGQLAGTDLGGSHLLHPTLLDSCFQVALLLAPVAEPGFIHLPLALRRASLLQRGVPFWAHARLRECGALMVVDVDILDAEGCVLARFEELSFRAVEAAQLSDDGEGERAADYLETVWQERARQEREVVPEQVDWLLMGADETLLGNLAAMLRQRGRSVSLALRGSTRQRLAETHYELDYGDPGQLTWLLQQLPRPLRLVWLYDERGAEPAAAMAASARWLALLQAVVASAEGVRVWLVTVDAMGARPEVNGAALWGMGRVFAREHEEAWAGAIDLTRPCNDRTLTALVAELCAPDRERQLWLHKGQRLALRLQALSRTPVRPSLVTTGCWLISGGLGALGLALAECLVVHGILDLALISRSAPSAETAARLESLRAAGARVRHCAVDLADAARLEQVLGELRADGTALSAVIHAAGVLDDAMVENLDRNRLEAVLRPKVMGAANLHQATLGDPLRHFVLFSSAAVLIGNPGQSTYAAANAYMDALAAWRRSEGLPGLSIAWGAWGEIGLMAAQSERERALTLAQGLRPFSTRQGLGAFLRLLGAEQAHLGYCPLEPGRLASSSLADWPYLELLRAEAPDAPAAVGAFDLERLRSAAASERKALLLDYLRYRVALALGSRPEQVETTEHLTTLGVNSLMIMEMRNQIKSELGISVPAVKFFRHPHLVSLADDLVADLAELASATSPAPEVHAALSVDTLNDDEVAALLAQMLEQGVDP